MSSGAIKGSKKINSIDLKYSLPELLINIEMFIFSILHLWAFPKKPYVVSNQATEVTDFYGNGKGGYEGGRWGMKALGDAMNPFDLVKAVGRSGRWLFVGRKTRMLDPSYRRKSLDEINLQNSTSGDAEAGTAMSGGRTGRYGGTPDEEGEVLLTHAQSNPESGPLGTSPYAHDAEEYLAGVSGSRFYEHTSSSSSYFPHEHPEPPGAVYQQDTAYHSAAYDPPVAPTGEHYSSNPYPSDGPLREAVPMPMPDPYRPPPPYPESHHGP